MKTKTEKIASGTYRKHRDKQPMNFVPLTKIPKPLAPLGEEGSRFYNIVCEILISNRILTAADVISVSDAAVFYEMKAKAWQKVQKEGFEYKTNTGYAAKSASFQVFSECSKALSLFYKCYGLSYASRTKMQFPKLPPVYTRLDELRDPKHKAGTPVNEDDDIRKI